MSAKTIQRVRKTTQFVFLGLFVYLFVQAVYLGETPLESDLFYRFDPLIAATAMLAGRTIIAGLLYGLVTLTSAFVFGRVWCGWVCPMGTMLDWISPKESKQEGEPQAGWRTVKYVLFAILIGAAALGNQTVAISDPISILTRTMTTAIWPALRYMVFSIEGFFYRFDALWPVLDVVNARVLLPLFQGIESVFISAISTALIFIVLIGLNWVAERFWCRYLCPLGGMLGIASRWAIFRRQVNDDCTDCGLCARECPTGTIKKESGYASDPAECVYCYDCAADCPVGAIHFRSHGLFKAADKQPYDPDRRQVIKALAGTAIGVSLAGVETINRRNPERMIRPPGATLTDFTSVCMRCGECVRVCPTQGLQPSLLKGGLQNIFTPRLVPRLGQCSFTCSACIQVCPTGAIPSITLEEKQSIAIGLASINTNRCLAWAYDTICSVCEEIRPLAEKAIHLEEAPAEDLNGNAFTILQPYVIRDLCIGCGACEYHCPVGGEAAIQVETLPATEGFLRGI